jgi:hypothetical protein
MHALEVDAELSGCPDDEEDDHDDEHELPDAVRVHVAGSGVGVVGLGGSATVAT